ncbi:MAG: hypothetical protein ACOZNI_33765 [Myxococcota bacterium]
MIWLVLACTSGGDTGGGACDRDPPLDYVGFGKGWMAKHCVGCHSSLVREDQRNGAPTHVDLDTYDDVVSWSERIRVRTIEQRDMPPGGGPSDEERVLLDEWLSCAVIP